MGGLGEADGLEKGLEKIGDGAGGADFEVAVEDGGDEAGDGGREVIGGEVGSGEELREVVGELGGELGLGFELGVVMAESWDEWRGAECDSGDRRRR